MTSNDWKEWLDYMKRTHGWTMSRCLRELGCGTNQGSRWGRSDPPRYIALACAAVALRIDPWDTSFEGRESDRSKSIKALESSE